MQRGDKVKIIKGLYKDTSGKLLSRITETNSQNNSRRYAWTCDVGNGIVLVYEDEVKRGL